MSDSLVALASMMEPLRGFVAVGRRMSITLAAADLCLTQSALSRQIQALEQRLGVRLFVRTHRAIAFTPAGARLFQGANGALQQLQDACAAIKPPAYNDQVALSASIGVTGLWLLPRLGSFQQQHPGIDLRVAANNRLQDLEREGLDLAIRYAPLAAAAPNATLLFRETIAPVAHPSLGIARLDGPADLAGHTLLEFDHPGQPWLHWESWLQAAGPSLAGAKSILRFNQYDQVIQSALAGHGIALGRLQLIEPMLRAGRLVQVPCAAPAHACEHAYWLVRAAARPRAEVGAVIDWIVGEAAAGH
ncbi:LysR substrate-binding domain-containing protein [Massilia antarctica]|uniref:LysR substrate-binding domain-containing protein n=1 Tax=Massilia antarctica TaxID=2765360 RepID=UPI0006BB6AF6|nr:LysR substrate-binding domain-containing protein [Massilia sp. H27-R4]MCY0911209.1 LysR substrate-binding domain-containing protein [Massilia sp. H27-R4]CUI05199.1 Glycine cleavage system transcriptional activator [Janthinobacterium sp. CG23_2]CUU28985.1 Glycine cleavage system transcriptional activator [Janthinobacterium sp. CG23_2]